MIQRIDENIKDLKIGLMGFRKDCFIHALKNHNLTYFIALEPDSTFVE